MINKLTDREKWLMNLAYSERGNYDKYTDLLNDRVNSYIANEAPKTELIKEVYDRYTGKFYDFESNIIDGKIEITIDTE